MLNVQLTQMFFLFHVFLSYLPVCLSVYSFVHLSACLFGRLLVRLSSSMPATSVCLSIYLPIFPSVCLSVCLSVSLSVYQSACLSACLPACLTVCLSVYLSAYLSVCWSVYLYFSHREYMKKVSDLLVLNYGTFYQFRLNSLVLCCHSSEI